MGSVTDYHRNWFYVALNCNLNANCYEPGIYEAYKVTSKFNMLVVCATLAFLLGTGANAKTYNKEHFKVAYYFQFVNFTWPSDEAYRIALNNQSYIPQNNVISGIKSYQSYIYVTLPRLLSGTPVTLARFPIESRKANPLLEPFPSWEQNVGESCSTLQNVQAVEIDTQGVIWILDGNRFNTFTKCPPKIVLIDINNTTVVQTYEVPNELSPHQGGWMNDLVIDESDGGYAYISEISSPDPGMIIFSRKQNRGWKIRDCSMFQELDAAGYVVHGIAVNGLYSIDGIALAPVPKYKNEERLVYYTALTGYNFYALSTTILKNESLCEASEWRRHVQFVGRRTGPTDGLIIDTKGNLYFGILNKNTISKWNIYKKPFNKYVKNVYTNDMTVDWPDSFGFDDYGNIYVTSNAAERLLNQTSGVPLPEDGVKIRILKHYTGTASYLYS